ncbi:MAG: hypothetical protein DKINENOH_01877 [bacterium]|nr:hypothetical protein [bacterium]MCK6558477.1 hypothetical protein [bacterium]NUM65479.1 hypothetical protein [candidate division KSB1 bacterium]
MESLHRLFELPAGYFSEEDLQELFEVFDPEKAEQKAAAAQALSPPAAEPASSSLADALRLLSLY